MVDGGVAHRTSEGCLDVKLPFGTAGRRPAVASPSVELTVRPATAADVPALHRIRVEAEDWLAGRGIEQWGRGHLPAEAIGRQVDDGQWHVGEVAGVLVGGLRLLPTDEEVWQADHVVAAYVHGLTIDRRFAGCGLGARLLAWAQEQAVAAGAPLLRLDCVESNPGLRAYYARLGFREVGRRDFDGPWLAATLLEKRL